MLKQLNDSTQNLLLTPACRVVRHVLIFLTVSLITVNVLWDEPTQIIAGRYGVWIVYFLLFMLVIYTNMYVFVPKLLLRGKAKRYLLLVVLMMLFFIISVGMLQSVGGEDGMPLRTPPWIGITSGFATFILFIIGLTVLQAFKFRMVNQQKIDALENANMAVELASLQNQINPHFLFNMLNSANIMVEHDPEKSAEILSRLKALLSYQIETSIEKSVSLDEEIAFLNDYLEMEKMRRDRFSYRIERQGNHDLHIPPLLFIPFVENAIKHNPGNDAIVQIVFRRRADYLYFECRNNKAGSRTSKKEGGIGLANIKRRLDLLFEKRYTLELNDLDDLYMVKLNIQE